MQIQSAIPEEDIVEYDLRRLRVYQLNDYDAKVLSREQIMK